jgi:hypothetical protein
MNKKNISHALNIKIDEWLTTITDNQLRKEMQNNIIVTGGALVSLLNNEEPNDYDIYFKTNECAFNVACYYASKWNSYKSVKKVNVKYSDLDNNIICYIANSGIVGGTNNDTNIAENSYTPKYFTDNAITLSDDIQIVLRFTGTVEEIHKNYDFVHCTCSYDYVNEEVSLPNDALECIINKELRYQGSKYPLCSIIRTRKFINRGYTINAGQYVKMAMQLNELNLLDITVLKDQLIGVDSLYFDILISTLSNGNPDDISTDYVIKLIDTIF